MGVERADGLIETVQRLESGELTARRLVEETLERIDLTQPTLNAFRRVRTEAALEEAESADRARARGVSLPLLGVPIPVKDDVDVAGEPTAFGCPGDFPVQKRDSELVRRLRAAGAIVVGKTNSSELGQWAFTEGPAYGVTRNPWNLGRTPGGSSGGAAAAVAGGLVPAALGSDGAGSVRIPSAWTHLVGIKPQRGRLSTWPWPEAFNGLTVNGPLARSVADAALLCDTVAGNHPGERHRPSPVDLGAAVRRGPERRLRIALSFRTPFTGYPTKPDPEVRTAVEELAGRLAALGHDVVEADPRYGAVGPAFVPRALDGFVQWAERVPDLSALDPRTRASIRQGRLLGGAALRAAQRAEGPLRRRIGATFDRFDVLLTPTTACVAPPIGEMASYSHWRTENAGIAHCPYAWIWNLLGWPGVNVPAGTTAGGLPVGAQLLGPEASEELLVGLAAELEEDLRWHERWPDTESYGVSA